MTKADLERLHKTLVNVYKYYEELEKDSPQNFCQPLNKTLTILDAEQTSKTHARITFRFPVLHQYVNYVGDLHGGATGMIFDMISGFPMFLIARSDFWPHPGVTRRLSYTLLSPAKEGEWLIAEGETVHVAKKLALLKGTIKREKDGVVVATCEHERYATVPPKARI